jgi:hypothetical protein
MRPAERPALVPAPGEFGVRGRPGLKQPLFIPYWPAT